MITTILFDVDGVLIDSFEANFEFFRRLFTKAGYTPPTKREYTNMFHLTMLDVIRKVTHTTNQQEIQRMMDMGKQRSTIYPYELIKTPPTLYQVIGSLHKNYTLGLVTSRINTGVFEIPQLTPLQQFFSVTVSFEDTEKHKPYPDPILHAINQLRVSPQETLYIGDQESDFLAAHAAHTHIIMISPTPYPEADGTITSFDALPNAILKVT